MKNNYDILKHISKTGNDMFSKFKGYDLQDLIILIDDYLLELRDNLGFSKDTTFGIEIEFENAKVLEIREDLEDSFPDGLWTTSRDTSLTRGGEITSPILIDNKKTWDDIDKVCSIVSSLAEIGKNSGGHIHIGTQTLGGELESWQNFLYLWSIYENIIFRFFYGSFLNARPNISRYAKPMAKEFLIFSKKNNENLYDIIRFLSRDRYHAVNFDNVIINNYDYFCDNNTIEFRCPNSTLDPVIWQNNVNLAINLLLYSKNSSFNKDIIDKRHKIDGEKYSSLKLYDEIYLEQALELCDMLFDNNVDKVYFLKQYLKSFKVSKNNDYNKGPILTRKKKNN